MTSAGEMQFGPTYDLNSAALKKHRRLAKGGLATMTRGQIVDYANAVEAAVLAKQKTQLARHGESMPAPHCASGTWHTTGEAIHKAVLQKQRAALLACPSQIRRARHPAEWERMYFDAMPAAWHAAREAAERKAESKPMGKAA